MCDMNTTLTKMYEVDGRQISKSELEEMEKNKRIRLKKISEDSYKTLQKLEG